MQASSVLSLSPSFNSYSSGNLAEIAARVVQEFRNELESEFDDFDDVYGLQKEGKLNDGAQVQTQVEEEEGDNFEEDENDDFEFPSVCRDPTPAISADEIFYNGQIRPIFPIFGRDLLFADVENGNGKADSSRPPTPASLRISLGKLMSEDRDPPSCSSSESDDLDGVPAETYCVWSPKAAAVAAVESPGRCKKSNSTGSSKRWKFRDFLHRSNSDGKDTFVFLNSLNGNANKNDEKAAAKETTEKCSAEVKIAGKVKPKVAGGGQCVPVMASHEAHHVRSKVKVTEGDRRRSLLPYRQDLVGLFANVNGLSKNLHPF